MQNIAKTIKSPAFAERHKTQPQAFTRNRKLPFSRVVFFLMNQVKGAIQDELDAYFEYVDTIEWPQDVVSKAAFCKARQFLKAEAFIELRDTLNRDFYASKEVKTWHGHRLCAVDCSKLTLPKNDAMLEQFGGRKNRYTQIPQATLSQCYDPLNALTLDAELSSSSRCERSIALYHLERMTEDCVFIYDRGYPGYWFYRAHIENKQHFCMRASLNTRCTYIQSFLSEEATDKIIEITASDKAKRICEEKGYKTTPLRLRMMKVWLPSGDLEILVTNLLDQSVYAETLFSDLYFKRWGVEEDFKQQKHTLLIERFSGKNVTAVMQDIHAKIVTKNIARLVSLAAAPRLSEINDRRRHVYQINFKQLLSKCKHTLVKALLGDALTEYINRCVDSMMRYLEPIRADRKYPRKRLVGTRSATHGTYKSVR